MAALKEKDVKKIGMQWKMHNWRKILELAKPKTSFRSAASAVRDSGVDVHRSFVA